MLNGHIIEYYHLVWAEHLLRAKRGLLGAQKEVTLLEKGISTITQTLHSLLHPGGAPSYDDAVVAAQARADQKRDHQRKLQREYDEADKHASELEEKAMNARSACLLTADSLFTAF